MNDFLLGQKAYFQMNVEGAVPQPASFEWLEWPFGVFLKWPFQRWNGHLEEACEDMPKNQVRTSGRNSD